MDVDPPQPPQSSSARPLNDLFDSVELAQAVETEEFKHFLDHIPIALVVSKRLRGEHRIVYSNRAFELKTGRTLAEIQGRDWSILDGFTHEDDPQITIGAALLKSDDILGTFCCKEPKSLLCEVYAGSIKNDDGTENYRIAVLVDVTERDREQRERFARQVRDKDILLSEIQHRVKNNLQLIAILIRLEARSQRLGEQVNLERLAGRIEAMQFLYEELSSKPVGETIDLGHYLSQIASGVMRTHATDGIKLNLKIESAPASINIAMPLGLVVNELLTNAFKYAFAGRDTGTISLRCVQHDDEHYQIAVADDGVGFPAGKRWPMEGKLGSLIVQTLRENVRTELDFRSIPGLGTEITLTVLRTPSALK